MPITIGWNQVTRDATGTETVGNPTYLYSDNAGNILVEEADRSVVLTDDDLEDAGLIYVSAGTLFICTVFARLANYRDSLSASANVLINRDPILDAASYVANVASNAQSVQFDFTVRDEAVANLETPAITGSGLTWAITDVSTTIHSDEWYDERTYRATAAIPDDGWGTITDTFEGVLTVEDELDATDTATVVITVVAPPNQGPVITSDQTFDVQQGKTAVFLLHPGQINDGDGKVLAIGLGSTLPSITDDIDIEFALPAGVSAPSWSALQSYPLGQYVTVSVTEGGSTTDYVYHCIRAHGSTSSDVANGPPRAANSTAWEPLDRLVITAALTTGVAEYAFTVEATDDDDATTVSTGWKINVELADPRLATPTGLTVTYT